MSRNLREAATSISRDSGFDQVHDAESGQANGKCMPEHVARIPARFHFLQSRVVALIVERVPWQSRPIQRGIEQIDVRMIDEGAVVAIAGNGDAASVGEEIAIEPVYPA